MWLRLCSRIGFAILGIEGEEIEVEDGRYSLQELSIYALLLKDFVYVGTVAIQLASEPSDASLFHAEALFYFMTNMYIHRKSMS